MIGGYMGRILYIDLSEKKARTEVLDPKLAKDYLGGSGLGAKLLYDMTDGTTDPLGKDNPLMFINGPFTGTRIPTSGRHAVVAKSPLTGIWGECDVGGAWGFELKSAGYDGVVVTGKSEKPV